MAKKGQKFFKHNENIKEIVLSRYLNDESSVSLGKKFGISQNTIQTWGKKIKYPEKYQKLGKRGRPKEKDLTKEDWKERYEILKKYNLMAEYIRKAKVKHKKERIEDNVKPNLLNRNFTTNAHNKVWDTDVTYLIFKGSRAYLSTIIDLYDRHVVSYVYLNIMIIN